MHVYRIGQPAQPQANNDAFYAKPELLNKQRILAICTIALSVLAIIVGVAIGPAAIPLIIAGIIGFSTGTIILGAADLQEAIGKADLSTASRASRVATGLLYITGGVLLPISAISTGLIFAAVCIKIPTWFMEEATRESRILFG